jgi:hypothetical protein
MVRINGPHTYRIFLRSHYRCNRVKLHTHNLRVTLCNIGDVGECDIAGSFLLKADLRARQAVARGSQPGSQPLSFKLFIDPVTLGTTSMPCATVSSEKSSYGLIAVGSKKLIVPLLTV